MPGVIHKFASQSVGFLCRPLLVCFICLPALPTGAGYISEIDLAGPAGGAVEVSQMLPASDYTLLMVDANPFSPASFGVVMGVVHLPAGTGQGGLSMVSDTAWPGQPTLTQPLATLESQSANGTLDLRFARLLVLMQGRFEIDLSDRLVNDPEPATPYDPLAVTDWLVVGNGSGQAAQYQNSGHDLPGINSALGIDLLSRLVDRSAGRVIGRTHPVGQAIDLETFYVGDPDATFQQFSVGAQENYTFTPGLENLPLTVDAMPGDTDGDGDVDDSDLGTSFASYTGPMGAAGGKDLSDGDTDSDGDVDDSDLGSSFAGYTGPLSPIASVPEPGALFGLGIGMLWGARRRSV